jgi:hypothetical protein
LTIRPITDETRVANRWAAAALFGLRNRVAREMMQLLVSVQIVAIHSNIPINEYVGQMNAIATNQ